MSDYQVLVEYDQECDSQIAGDCMKVLCHAYPGHPWHVNVTGGLIVIKHLRISAKWAMNLHYKKVVHDAKKLRHGIVWAGGEFLERAHKRRGADDGQRIVAVEGIPRKDLTI